MNSKRISRCLVGLFVTASMLTAQGQTPKPQDQKPQGQATKPQEAKPQDAGSKAEPGVPLTFTVTGLSATNTTQVSDSLKALTKESYACEMCKHEQAAAGKCPGCKGDLMAKKQPLFRTVTPSAEASTVVLVPNPSANVHLTEIEKTLEKSSVKIDTSKLTIPGKAQLVFKGASADLAPKIEKALADAKLFQTAKASHDATSNEVRVAVNASATAPTRARLIAALEAAGVKTELTDIVWGPTPKNPMG